MAWKPARGFSYSREVRDVVLGMSCLLQAQWQYQIFPTKKYLIGGFSPSEKYESQIGSSSQLLGKIKFMFQSTNQISH
jgi:hypothetical protein